MSVHIVQLGAPRVKGEGVRLGTVRRPPRGVPKEEYALRNYYDVWLPNLAPSQELMSAARAGKFTNWDVFVRKYRAEMSRPESSHVLDALAALSHTADFAVGCYCDDETRCHRSALRTLLEERGAKIA